MKTRNTKHKSASLNERRVVANSDLRAITKGNKQTIFGYAALFAPAQTQDMNGWREEVSPKAFDRCLRSSPDVVALFNHNSDALPLARTTSGTLRLSTDSRGLKYEFEIPNTQAAHDLAVSMQRGDVHQSSYGFRCLSESWRNDSDGTPIRTVLDADLIDVSPVVFPATLDTTSGVRMALRNAPASVRAKLLRAQSKTKTVDSVELPADSFAFVGDPDKPDTWKLPIHFPGDDAKTESHIKDALARFDQTEGIPASEKAHVYAKIVGAAKAHGIHVTADKLEDRDWDDDGYDDPDSDDPDGTDNDDDSDIDDSLDDERKLHLDLIARRLR